MDDQKPGLAYNIVRQLSKTRVALRNAIRTFYPQYGFRTSDVVIASYPKSGRNWVRFLLANAIVRSVGRDDEIHFLNSSEWISTTVPRKPPVEDDSYPRFVADHREYQGENTRVIYILRHPADVMESYYVYLRDRWNESVGEFSSFVRDNDWGIPAWRSHVISWEDHINLLVKFEDLNSNPEEVLEKMYGLFDRDIDDEVVRKAVELSSFENMKRMEEKYGIPNKAGASQDFKFMRSGSSDQGKAYFDDDLYRYLLDEAGDVMDRYGYEVPVSKVEPTA